MKPAPKKNLTDSIRARLLNLAKARGEDFDLILKRYAIERLLYRLSQSPHANAFILKGAMLFELWMGGGHRTTRDLDLLGIGSPEIPLMESVFKGLCNVVVEDDGLAFQPDSVRGAEIREGAHYQGVRITLLALLGGARISTQVDIGFGDAVFPAPEVVEYPSLLDLPRPHLRAYQRETVIAEKVHAMVELGLANTRLKDYYDIWRILEEGHVEPAQVRQALESTFARRRTELPASLPVGLTSAFAEDPIKQAQWRAMLRKTGSTKEADLPSVVQKIAAWIGPLLGT